MLTMAGSRLGWNQKPGTQSRSSTRTSGNHPLELYHLLPPTVPISRKLEREQSSQGWNRDCKMRCPAWWAWSNVLCPGASPSIYLRVDTLTSSLRTFYLVFPGSGGYHVKRKKPQASDLFLLTVFLGTPSCCLFTFPTYCIIPPVTS